MGYIASESTLGARTRQQIKDIPAQIEVITEEMLQDFAVNTVGDSFKSHINVENADKIISPKDGGEAASWGGKRRSAAYVVSNRRTFPLLAIFSAVSPSPDAYNISHISIASGAQSLLFSLGEPAGIANVQLNTAQYGCGTSENSRPA